jgi:hypothetical protein
VSITSNCSPSSSPPSLDLTISRTSILSITSEYSPTPFVPAWTSIPPTCHPNNCQCQSLVIIPLLHLCRWDLNFFFRTSRFHCIQTRLSSVPAMSHTCHCPSCDASSPLSRSGVPTGVRFTKHAYKAHQLRINREATDSLPSLSETTDVTGDTTENLDEELRRFSRRPSSMKDLTLINYQVSFGH